MTRLFNGEGLFSFDALVNLCTPIIRHIKGGAKVYGYVILEELYTELVIRKEIEPIENLEMEKKIEYWKKAKATGEKERITLIQMSRSLYLCDII